MRRAARARPPFAAPVLAVTAVLAAAATGVRALAQEAPPAPAVALEEAGAPLDAAAGAGTDGAADAGAADAEGIEFGGALRFTAFDDSFSDALDTRRGAAGLDLFRVNADGRTSGIEVSAEYRFYPYMQTIHHGWIGYDFERAGRLEGA